MRNWLPWIGILSFLCMVGAPAAEAAEEIRVLDAVVATGVEERQPVGVSDTFPPDVNRVYAFTRIVGMDAPGTVTHVWYYAGRIMAQVELPVRSPNWRTWSSKSILPAWTGQWLVEVVDAEGAILHALPFTVE